MKKNIFLSYAAGNQSLISGIGDELKKRGMSVDLHGGNNNRSEDWGERHKANILKATRFIALVSDEYIKSPHSFVELGSAIASNAEICLISIDKIKIPAVLNKYKLVDYSQISKSKLPAQIAYVISSYFEQDFISKIASGKGSIFSPKNQFGGKNRNGGKNIN